MAKQKFRSTRPGGFSGVKAYISYVKVLKNRHNAVGRTFCDAMGFLLCHASSFKIIIAPIIVK